MLIGYRVFGTLASMAIMREWMNPFSAAVPAHNDPAADLPGRHLLMEGADRQRPAEEDLVNPCRGRGCSSTRAKA